MSRVFIPRMGGDRAHMSGDPDAVQRLALETLRRDFGVDVAPAAGLRGQELATWLEQAEDAVFEREHAELRAQRTYRPRPADEGGFYFLSGDEATADQAQEKEQ